MRKKFVSRLSLRFESLQSPKLSCLCIVHLLQPGFAHFSSLADPPAFPVLFTRPWPMGACARHLPGSVSVGIWPNEEIVPVLGGGVPIGCQEKQAYCSEMLNILTLNLRYLPNSIDPLFFSIVKYRKESG